MHSPGNGGTTGEPRAAFGFITGSAWNAVFVLPLDGYDDLTRWGDANRVWLEKAEELGEQAIDLALERAGMERSRIDALLTVSVTGLASPSLDAHLTNRMHLSPAIRRTPISGWGAWPARQASRRLPTTCGRTRTVWRCCSPWSCAR